MKHALMVKLSKRIAQDLQWCAAHGIGGSSPEEVAAWFIQNGVVRLIEAHVLPLSHDKPKEDVSAVAAAVADVSAGYMESDDPRRVKLSKHGNY